MAEMKAVEDCYSLTTWLSLSSILALKRRWGHPWGFSDVILGQGLTLAPPSSSINSVPNSPPKANTG